MIPQTIIDARAMVRDCTIRFDRAKTKKERKALNTELARLVDTEREARFAFIGENNQAGYNSLMDQIWATEGAWSK